MKTFTARELSSHDGKDGRPAYVAYAGLVYDVSESFLWQGGVHQVLHRAGVDLTADLDGAPHGPALLERCPIVGRIVDEEGGGNEAGSPSPRGDSYCS